MKSLDTREERKDLDIVSPDVSIPNVFEDEEEQETVGDVSIQTDMRQRVSCACTWCTYWCEHCATAKKLNPGQVTMQAEDFGGGLAVPNYGHRRPPADYYNSNLIFHNYATTDIGTGK